MLRLICRRGVGRCFSSLPSLRALSTLSGITYSTGSENNNITELLLDQWLNSDNVQLSNLLSQVLADKTASEAKQKILFATFEKINLVECAESYDNESSQNLMEFESQMAELGNLLNEAVYEVGKLIRTHRKAWNVLRSFIDKHVKLELRMYERLALYNFAFSKVFSNVLALEKQLILEGKIVDQETFDHFYNTCKFASNVFANHGQISNAWVDIMWSYGNFTEFNVCQASIQEFIEYFLVRCDSTVFATESLCLLVRPNYDDFRFAWKLYKYLENKHHDTLVKSVDPNYFIARCKLFSRECFQERPEKEKELYSDEYAIEVLEGLSRTMLYFELDYSKSLVTRKKSIVEIWLKAVFSWYPSPRLSLHILNLLDDLKIQSRFAKNLYNLEIQSLLMDSFEMMGINDGVLLSTSDSVALQTLFDFLICYDVLKHGPAAVLKVVERFCRLRAYPFVIKLFEEHHDVYLQGAPVMELFIHFFKDPSFQALLDANPDYYDNLESFWNLDEKQKISAFERMQEQYQDDPFMKLTIQITFCYGSFLRGKSGLYKERIKNLFNSSRGVVSMSQ